VGGVARTAKLPRNVKKCNSQATGPGYYPPVPEVNTVVERSNLVQNSKLTHLLALKCILYAFVTLASKSKSKKCPAYVGESCEENKNDPIPRVALSQRAEPFWHALHPGHDGGLFFFSLSFLPLSVLFQKPIWERTRQDGSHADGTGGI
jgi:hypothetical protein